MNGKEALERLDKHFYLRCYSFDTNENSNIREYEIIKQDLDRLEQLEDNIKIHKETIKMQHNQIESLRSENEILKKSIENSNKSYDILMQNSNIQFLNQNQEIFKLKKVIEMLKNKLDIEIYEIHENGVTEYYLDCSAGEVIDEQKEYDLLKEWFGNEK